MRLFEDADLPAMNEWYRAHGQAPVRRDMLPTTGFIVPGVAVGFLYRTDAQLALVHHVVTNPAAGLRARHRAVRAIVGACQDTARGLGLREILTWSDVPSIVRVAGRAGGRVVGEVTLVAQALSETP